MNRSDVLKIADKLISGDRQQDYGDAHENFADIAASWTLYLGVPVVATDVSMMMALLKIMRIKNGDYKDDNAIDLAGYAALYGEIAGGIDEPKL